jgi:flavin reductase (DIM6/NTAB) family NADH-FMN oxidoreductase RutF
MISHLLADLSPTQTQMILQSAIAPRPIAFVSTIDENGAINLSPFSFFNMFSANPPIAIFSPAKRVRDNSSKHTLENVLQVKECVINMVSYEMVQQMSLASTDYPKGVDEFVKAGFTALSSDIVKPPRVKESPVQMECIVKEVIALGDAPGAGNLVIAEIIKIHIAENILDAEGKIDPFKINQVARLGGDWYARITEDSLFKVAKPLTTMGIGVDQIPYEFRNSTILTGNHLGKLGNVEQVPTISETEHNKFKIDDKMVLHQKIAALLDVDEVLTAWKIIIANKN